MHQSLTLLLSIWFTWLGCLSCLGQQTNQEGPTKLRLLSGYRIVKKHPFVVNPDDLRRVATVLQRAATKMPVSSSTVFGVVRADTRFYETTNIDEVFADPNVRGKHINWIKAEIRVTDAATVADRRGDSTLASVVFDANPLPQVTIQAAADDRSWALAIADELEPQVERTVNSKTTPVWLLAILGFSLLLLLVRLRRQLPAETIPRFILDMVAHPAVWGVSIGLLLGSYRLWSQSDAYRRLFGPVYGFAWGDYERVMSDWSRVRESVFWVVIVGLLVTIAGNLLTTYVWGQSKKTAANEARTADAKKEG